MKITAKCPCGATFDGEDNGDPFDRGDLLMAHRRWLESHDHVPPITATPSPTTSAE